MELKKRFSEANSAYAEYLTDILPKAPIWKYAALALNGVIYEYMIYECLAKDCVFDMSKHLKRAVDRFWAAVSTGYAMDEKYLLAMEESRFQPKDNLEGLALEIVEDLIFFFYAVYDKDKKNLLELCSRQVKRIQELAELLKKSEEERFAMQETFCRQSMEFAGKLALVSAREKKEYLAFCAQQTYHLPFADEIAQLKMTRKKEKPAKKSLPEIRPVSLDVEYIIRRQRPESNPKNRTWEQLLSGAGACREAYEDRHYCDLCHYMALKCRLWAEEDFFCNQNPERVLGWWYLSAKADLYSWKLYQKGFPVHFNNTAYDLNREIEWQIQHLVMLRAYAAGAEEMLSEIASFEKPKGDAEKLLAVLTGNGKAQQYELLRPWRNLDGKALDAVLDEDDKTLRQCVQQRIRADRRGFHLNPIALDIYAYACLRFASKCGRRIKPVNAFEVLFGNVEVSMAPSQWKLPYEDEILEIFWGGVPPA